MICERCGKPHEGTYGSGRFCSAACAHAREITPELKQRISKTLTTTPPRFCKTCGKVLNTRNAIYCRDHWAGHGKYGVSAKNITEYLFEKQKQVRERCIELAGGKCRKCGYSTYSGSLDFHHIDPETKLFEISSNGLHRRKESLLTELGKCILLCSNCHRELHHRLLKGETLGDFLEVETVMPCFVS